jgi:glyoxylase-like metal-dependent hydrolase (beta-lactamase superfamily II)
MKFPPNPGANPLATLPNNVHRLPQEADINLVGQKTNCYLLFIGGGTWVVDPPSARREALDEIEAAAKGGIVGILLTHTHGDHTGGVAALVERTGVTVYAHPKALPYLADGLPFSPLNEGDTVEGWPVFAMPGHRFDSLCFLSPLLPSPTLAIVGDLVAGGGTVVLDPSDGDLLDYLNSLHRLRDQLRPALLAPGHGPLIDEPERLLTYYINHRLAREELVLQALGNNPHSLNTLLPHVYSQLEPKYYPLAARSLLSHLIKLQKEGDAKEMEGGWLLSP